MKRSIKMLIVFFFTYLSTMLLCIGPNFDNAIIGDKSFLQQLTMVLNNFDIIDIVMGIVIYFFYYSIYFIDEYFNKKKIVSVLSVCFSIFIVIGKYLELTGVFPYLFKPILIFETIIMFLGSYLIFYAILKKLFLINWSFDNDISKKKSKYNKLVSNVIAKVKKHPILFVFMLIFLFRVPYLIIYYPGNNCGDTLDQLCQFYNMKCSWSKDMVLLVNDHVFLNNHHPVFSTLYMAFFVQIGKNIYNFDFGLFLYTLFQTIISSLVFSFVLHYMKKNNISNYIYLFSLIMICIFPYFSSYTILAVKDTPQALFTVLYIIFLIQIVRDSDSVFKSKIKIILLIFTMLFTMLFRHNGIITILFSFPFLIFVCKKYYKKILVILFIPLILYFSFNKIMYTFFDVSKGSKKEMYSIPFMQIARLVTVKDSNVIEKKDQKVIDKVIKYNKLSKKYYPNLSDGVKDLYNKNCTDKELRAFLNVWFKYFKKYPTIYVASFINSTYQYFYPYETYENSYLGYDLRISKNFHDATANKKHMYTIKNNYSYCLKILYKLPFIGLLFKVAFYDWLLILSTVYVIYNKKYKYLIPLMALLSVLLVCLASPINGSMRYILPIFFSFPLILSIDYLVYKESN